MGGQESKSKESVVKKPTCVVSNNVSYEASTSYTPGRKTEGVAQCVRENTNSNDIRASTTQLHHTLKEKETLSLQFTNSRHVHNANICSNYNNIPIHNETGRFNYAFKEKENAKISGNFNNIPIDTKILNSKQSLVIERPKQTSVVTNQSIARTSYTPGRKTEAVAQCVTENINLNAIKTSSTQLPHTLTEKETSSLQFTNSRHVHKPNICRNSNNIPIDNEIDRLNHAYKQKENAKTSGNSDNNIATDKKISNSFKTDLVEHKSQSLYPSVTHEIDELNLNSNVEKEFKFSGRYAISNSKTYKTQELQNSAKNNLQVNCGIKSAIKSTEKVVDKLQYSEPTKYSIPETNSYLDNLNVKQTSSSKINNAGITEPTRNYIPSAPVETEFHNFSFCGLGRSHDRIGYDELYQGNINLHELMDSCGENYKTLNVKYYSGKRKTNTRGRSKKTTNAHQFQGRGRRHNNNHLNRKYCNRNNIKHIPESNSEQLQHVGLGNRNYYSSMESVASTLSQNEYGSNPQLSDVKSNHSKEPFDIIKWKALRDVSITKPNQVVKSLIDQFDFSDAFNEELEFEDVILVFSILSVVSNSRDERKSIILWHTIKPELFNQISKCILSLHLKFNKESVDKMTEFVFNICTYSYSLIQLFPEVGSYIKDVNEKLDLALKMFELQHKVQLRSDLKTMIKEIFSLIQNSNIQTSEEVKSHNQSTSDFRQINIIPSLQYLNYVIVNTNKAVHQFNNINDYLEYCFTSEYNSFVSSLKEAVNYARSRNRRYKKTGYQLHKNIEFGSRFWHSESTYILIFGKDNASLNSKQFQKGSLLILTEDSFDSIIFASVYDAHPKYLSNGNVIVKLLNLEQYESIDFQTKKFDMMETSIRFDNYEYILKGLQNKSQVAKSVYEYFINCKDTIKKPCYIDNEKEVICFNIDGNFKEEFTGCTWHLNNCKNLDTSQAFALKTALSNELTLIKGGPGTGKTFLCLEFIRVLLLNSSIWSKNKVPILVIFENKDVLDHFMELLIKIENNVLTLGVIPPSKTLKCHNINYKISGMRNIIQMEQQVAQYKQVLMNSSNDIDTINSNKGIISIESFKKYIPQENLKYFMFNNCLDDTLFIRWLIGENYDKAVEYQGQYTDLCHKQKYSDVITAISLSKLTKDLLEIDAKIEENKLNHFLLLALKRKQFELSTLNALLHISCEPILKENIDNINLWDLERNKRWNLYYYWINKFRDDILEKMNQQKKCTNTLENALQKVKHEMEISLINRSSVVAVTVSDALRLQSTLGSTDFKIVIVNDADRVPEPELVLIIPHSCQHFIMFGDEKVNETNLSRLPPSLFYRMCDDYSCVTLTTQHRMVPEISNMVLQHFYNLDSWSTENKLSNNSKKVLGIKSNVVFINHNNIEKQEHKILSFTNDYEAHFVIGLCQYLLLQGYSQNEITILSMYGAQVAYIQNKVKQLKNFSGVTIKSVDNYKGKENRIVILSLVRNNDLGCLQSKHKVSIAFSRAREGLYVIGCLNKLSTKSQMWNSIQNSTLCQDLALQCQIHNNQELVVVNPADFKQWANGSCPDICKKQLRCGHICKLVCHLKDKNHSNYKCQEPCKRSPDKCKHSCPKMCFEDCVPCTENVERTLSCGHTVILQCCIEFETYKCTVEVHVDLPCGHKGIKHCHQGTPAKQCKSLCENRLPCGHQCLRKCHIGHDPDHLQYICVKPCGKRRLGCTMDHKCQKKCHEQCELCTEMVKKKLPCDHSKKMKCNKSTKDEKCLKQCKNLLKCGHPCKLKCFESCTMKCLQLVQKKLPGCGHVVNTECSALPDPSMCLQPCQRILPCTHKCQNKCNEMCTTDCKVITTDKLCLYGHKMDIPCSFQNHELTQELSKWCSAPCQTVLECGHTCRGSCGSCFQGRVHKPCQEDCGKPLICGHICDAPCPSNCPPCEKPCSYSCSHSKCSKLCGEPCIQCIEKCVLGCAHSQCTKLCYELCDREPCTQPCMKRLKCMHKCIGFCGEPCPTLCRICNANEVKTVLFGFEDPDDDYETRFVYLEDCKHNIESRGLEKWLTDAQDGIMMKRCPICRVPILKTQRYMNIIKTTYKDMRQIKIKIFGKDIEIEKGRQVLEKKFQSIKMLSNGVLISPFWEKFLQMYKDKISTVRGNRRNTLNQLDIKTLDLQVDLLHRMIKDVKSVITMLDTYSCEKLQNQILFLADLLLCRGRYLSAHEVKDINLEVDRFYCLTQLCQIESNRTYKNNCNNPAIQIHYDLVRSKIRCWKPFSSSEKEIVQRNMQKLKDILHIRFSEVERAEFLKVIQMKQGRWYKCPNGHFYVITECGRPVVTSTCPECHEKIGGLNKKLIGTNKPVNITKM